jgi:methyl-accepting chemotaxis protein
MNKGIVSKGSYKMLLIAVVGIFLAFSLMSALVLYKNLHVPLGPHYGAAHYTVTQIKDSLMIKTIIISLVFCFSTAAGISVIGIFYSHRIAGPLFKVKQHARVLSKGRFDEKICFRKKDANQSLANVLNEMAQSCQERIGLFASQLREMEDSLNLYSSLPGGTQEKAELIKRLQELDAGIRENNQEIKL